jgi:hypothetical protein
MNEQKDFSGLKFNKLTVIGNAPSRRTPCGDLERRVMVKCDCGNEKDMAWKSVKQNKIKSCGCLGKDKIDIGKETQYGHWTIIEEIAPYIQKDGSKMRKVKVKCVCGNSGEVTLNSLKQRRSNSCGCKVEHKKSTADSPIPEMTIEKMNERPIGSWKIIEVISAKRNEKAEIERTVKVQCKCGYIKTSLLRNVTGSKSCARCSLENKPSKYSEEEKNLRKKIKGIHAGMRQRCNDINCKDYKNYGGRGIKLSGDFLSPEFFYQWAITSGYTIEPKVEIDRIDNSLGYYPENCRWVSKAENCRNMRNNVLNWDMVNLIRGEYLNMSSNQISELLEVSVDTINNVRRSQTWVL